MTDSVKHRFLTAMLVFAAMTALVASVFAARALAYTGEYCYGVYLNVNYYCSSNVESNLRRAIGHGGDYSTVYVTNNPGTIFATNTCYSDGCTADSGYLPQDVTGYGTLDNAGDPCDCGGGTYYGWLYA